MKLLFLLWSVALFCQEFNHPALGITLEYPDDWRFLVPKKKQYDRRRTIGILYPSNNAGGKINFTTGPKRDKELSYYKTESGKQKLMLALMRDYKRFIANISLKSFTLVNDEKGLGFTAEFTYTREGRHYYAYQRSFLGVLYYYILTLNCPLSSCFSYRPLMDAVKLEYPRVYLESTWREK